MMRYGDLPLRNHNCNQPKTSSGVRAFPPQTWPKPEGLWYGIKDSWLTWDYDGYENPDELPGVLVPISGYLYEVTPGQFTTVDNPDPKKILMLVTPEDYRRFDRLIENILAEMSPWHTYDEVTNKITPSKVTNNCADAKFTIPDDKSYYIWAYVSQLFAGVEFHGVSDKWGWERHLWDKYVWLYMLDVDSGCVWNPAAVTLRQVFPIEGNTI